MDDSDSKISRNIGILGYGALGQFIHQQILTNPLFVSYGVSFIWNRTSERLDKTNIPEKLQLKGGALPDILEERLSQNDIDIVIETAHPHVVMDALPVVLNYTDFMPTSLSAFAFEDFEQKTNHLLAALSSSNGIYIPAGASWGAEDVKRIAVIGKLNNLRVKMTFGPESLRLNGEWANRLNKYIMQEDRTGPLLLGEGSIRYLAKNAPNNTNTIVCLALAAGPGGMDKYKGELWAIKNHPEHRVEIEIIGSDNFKVRVDRFNPSRKGAVTGNMTFYSFCSSLLSARDKGAGIHFC